MERLCRFCSAARTAQGQECAAQRDMTAFSEREIMSCRSMRAQWWKGSLQLSRSIC